MRSADAEPFLAPGPADAPGAAQAPDPVLMRALMIDRSGRTGVPGLP
jgi:hypothetical protein